MTVALDLRSVNQNSSRTTVLQLLKSRTHATVSDRWYYASTLMKSIFKLFYINSWSNTGGTYIRRNAKISILIFGKFNFKLYQCTISEFIFANVLVYSVNLTFFPICFNPSTNHSCFRVLYYITNYKEKKITNTHFRIDVRSTM